MFRILRKFSINPFSWIFSSNAVYFCLLVSSCSSIFFILRILPSKPLRGYRNPQNDEYEANEEGTFVDIETSDNDIYVD